MVLENQVEVIKNQFGDIDKIRTQLGLSQRQMAQLLMVDPSTWTRWQKQKKGAPPHIYRALQWLMIIREQLPDNTIIPVQPNNTNTMKIAKQLDAQFFEKQMKEQKIKKNVGTIINPRYEEVVTETRKEQFLCE